MDQNHQDHSWKDPVEGQRVRITGASGSSFAKSLEGKEGTVTKVFSEPDDDHDPESLPMFKVHFDEGPLFGIQHGALMPADGDPELWCDELEVLDGSNT